MRPPRIVIEKKDDGNYRAYPEIFCSKWFKPVDAPVGSGGNISQALSSLESSIRIKIFNLDETMSKLKSGDLTIKNADGKYEPFRYLSISAALDDYIDDEEGFY